MQRDRDMCLPSGHYCIYNTFRTVGLTACVSQIKISLKKKKKKKISYLKRKKKTENKKIF